jgi:hypothetical protein
LSRSNVVQRLIALASAETGGGGLVDEPEVKRILSGLARGIGCRSEPNQNAAAWDARYQSPENLRRANRLAGKAMDRLIKQAKRDHYDQHATEDRRAIADAVRNSGKFTPDDRPVKYGDMTDAEFAAERRKHGV